MMYAVIESGSMQHRVSKGDIVDIETISAQDQVSFDRVLLVAGDEKVAIGTPYVAGAKVTAKIIGNVKDEKVTTFKYKAKVNYHRTIGHRQPHTRVQIEEISCGA